MNFHQEIEWRKSLIPLPVGTVVRWISDQPFVGSTARDRVVKGECLLITEVRMPVVRPFDGYEASKTYRMPKCTAKNFKPMKREFNFYVDSVAKWLLEGKIEILREIK
jgi:hypothetical protein